MSDERAKNTAPVESMESMERSRQKEIRSLNVYSSDMDDAVASGMGFLGGCVQIAHRISEPQLRDAVIHKLGVPKDDAC
eukprot:3939995-Pyramimonas_sp.AAC.1